MLVLYYTEFRTGLSARKMKVFFELDIDDRRVVRMRSEKDRGPMSDSFSIIIMMNISSESQGM